MKGSELGTACSKGTNKFYLRPGGGIEPLCLSTPTGLKPALQTTEGHLDNRSYYLLACNYKFTIKMPLTVWKNYYEYYSRWFFIANESLHDSKLNSRNALAFKKRLFT